MIKEALDENNIIHLFRGEEDCRQLCKDRGNHWKSIPWESGFQ